MLLYNTSISLVFVTMIIPLSIVRSNDYTEFKTCTRCNPVVTDSDDSLETAAIGMCVDE